MTEKELKKLSRADLLELLVAQTRENERLSEKNKELQKELADRCVVVEKAGSIADASLLLSGIFEAAQEAADIYIESVKGLKDRGSLEEDTRERCRKMEQETKERCDALLEETRESIKRYWSAKDLGI